jgi:hypothetical protein
VENNYSVARKAISCGKRLKGTPIKPRHAACVEGQPEIASLVLQHVPDLRLRQAFLDRKGLDIALLSGGGRGDDEASPREEGAHDQES